MMRRVVLILLLTLTLISQQGEVAAQGSSASLELRPKSCKAIVTEGARSAEAVCTKIVINTFRENLSSITFVVRDSAGTWHFLQTYIKGTQVAQAAQQGSQQAFDVFRFFVFPADQAGKKPTERLPLQGTCRLSQAEIACRTNDTMLGFVAEATM
ncbi:hypothetical protein P0R31_37025 [Bradyrhizobium yuanmingense]|uniref:hypothetical protein n=1 Tax=Bradyrhizobium yuanmingense TaxID=108015 RepID=UPI0023B8BE5D|nr:hypothetical protein [Bradyrhizobium yuanmingense]MDF0522842.1 hypothetical protein [Bradyrhizobium yuanmingense]